MFTSLFYHFCFRGDKCMPSSNGLGILPLDPEIKRTLPSFRKINKNLSFDFAMADDSPTVRQARNANVLQAQQG